MIKGYWLLKLIEQKFFIYFNILLKSDLNYLLMQKEAYFCLL